MGIITGERTVYYGTIERNQQLPTSLSVEERIALHTATFLNRCVRETLTGLREGLSLFSGTSRAAVIFSLTADDQPQICDPQNLLRGYEPRLKAIYQESQSWKNCAEQELSDSYNYIVPHHKLQLDGLLSIGGSSGPVFYQMWFTEHHPNICSVLPTECWLEHAVLRFSHDIANGPLLYTGISGSFLREYGTHAVRDCIVDKAGLILGMDVQVRVYPVLDAILGISKTSEEGARPYGALAFVEPRLLNSIPFLAKFLTNEQPLLDNFKHVRKLLQAVEHSDRTLISDGRHIVGIAPRAIEVFHISADFQGKQGYFFVFDELIASFQDGSYSSNTYRAKLYEVEEALLDFKLESATRNNMFQIVASLVHNAEEMMFGCTFVIDLADDVTEISGQAITPPLDLKDSKKLQLAAALSRVDGALHIRKDLLLHGFACLLDGHRVDNEDRARGARYNSALRFTARHHKTIVVVVSSDRPVSVFMHGEEIGRECRQEGSAACNLYPEILDDWLQSA